MTEKPKSLQIVKEINIGQFLESQKAQIINALPKHISADRMMRVLLTEIRKDPKLGECTLASLMSAFLTSSQLGLEPGGGQGLAYLIAYKNGKTGMTDCQFQIGYKGLIELARRSGQISTIYAHTVYEGDEFTITFGLNEDIKHIPRCDDPSDNKIIGVYSIAKLKDGGYQMDWMFKKEVDKTRSRSKTSNYGPWVTDYAEMAKKTVLRRMCKLLPTSIELQQAISMDMDEEAGKRATEFTFDGEAKEIPTKAQILGMELEKQMAKQQPIQPQEEGVAA